MAAGFAQGMIYPPETTWGNPGNKLVGTYEKELMPYWQALDAHPPRVVFDIGAAEGYYAVGSALRWPGCRVYAWEADKRSRRELQENVARNAVEERLHVQSACQEETLFEALGALTPDLIIMDVEGEEAALCSERCIGQVHRAAWVVECHQDAIVQRLAERFAPTHQVTTVANQPRTADDCVVSLPWYSKLLRYDRWRLVYEGRPFPTPWLVATPR